MNEKKLSELQKEYRAFFLKKMRLYAVNSPAELTKAKKSEFFTEIKQDWAKQKLLKKPSKEADKHNSQITAEEPIEIYEKKAKKESEIQPIIPVNEWTEQEYKTNENKDKKQQQSDRNSPSQEQERTPREFTKQIIKSEPNQERTADLRILFNPNTHFEQEGQYLYPVVKMPTQKAILKQSIQESVDLFNGLVQKAFNGEL